MTKVKQPGDWSIIIKGYPNKEIVNRFVKKVIILMSGCALIFTLGIIYMFLLVFKVI